MSNNFTTEKKKVDIKLVRPNPWNPNTMSKEMFEKAKHSLKELGMLGSILVREVCGIYEILDGEHRWKAAKELEYTEITVESLGEIDDQKAKVLTVMLNNLKGKDDLEKRAAIFKELNENQMSLLPFTKEEIENEIKLFNFDFSQYQRQEKIEEREVTNSVCFGFTEEERRLRNESLLVAKKKDGITNDVQLLMYMLNDYLAIRVFKNDDGSYKF